MSQLAWLDDTHPTFPPTTQALSDPNGLLAAGGNLQPSTLLAAYSRGIFPWYSNGQPILWWSPSPRMTLQPSAAHFGRSLRKLAKKHIFEISVDEQFSEVMSHCANIKREGQDGTWITEDILEAYVRLHDAGYAHSIEAWHNDKLVGGLYGVAIGKAFFGESMFSLMSGASKMAFSSLIVQLNAWGYTMVDCQMHTNYLASFGATEIQREKFEKNLTNAIQPCATNQSLQNQITSNGDTYIAPPQTPPIHIVNWQKQWQLPKYGYDGLNLNDTICHVKTHGSTNHNLTSTEKHA